jgi:hypothetical protein
VAVGLGCMQRLLPYFMARGMSSLPSSGRCRGPMVQYSPMRQKKALLGGKQRGFALVALSFS